MLKPEILAPVGGGEQLIAAVRCGADAVYLGTRSFSARAGAENFDKDGLINAVKYCHARGVKVYVAMNTLITDKEIGKALNEVRTIALSGADAVIVQDLGIAALWRKYCPTMRLHASTQMTVHNVSGAKECEKLGFKRIVLARELTLGEIKSIAENTGAEIEVFVHGALCVSVSGTCLLSSMLGARSGNRGRCAQPCRLDFKCGSRERALSLKDLSLIDKLDELRNIGVNSFKIEGRMKRPEYVAAAVTAVKNALNGDEYDGETLKAVFSRSGFTSGYLDGKRNLDMFGYRRHEDVTSAAPVLKRLSLLYKDEIKKIPVKISFKADKNMSRLDVSDGENEVSVTDKGGETSLNKPLDGAYAEKMLSKTGGTVFYADSFVFDIENGISVSASQMNAMRRNALEKLYDLRFTAKPKLVTTVEGAELLFSAPQRKTEKTAVRLSFESLDNAFDDERADKIMLPMRDILNRTRESLKFGGKLVCELPFLVFEGDEKSFLKNLERLKSLGVKEVSADNIGTLAAAVKMGFTVHGGHGLNILNSEAAREYEKLGAEDLTVSPELSIDLIEKIRTNKKIGIIGYGFLPLMRFRACPARSEKGCAGCGGKAVIKDRFGTDFGVICSDRKYSSLLNSVPLYIGDKSFKNIDFVTLRFTSESVGNGKKILDAFCNKRKITVKKTGGLYFRELL